MCRDRSDHFKIVATAEHQYEMFVVSASPNDVRWPSVQVNHDQRKITKKDIRHKMHLHNVHAWNVIAANFYGKLVTVTRNSAIADKPRDATRLEVSQGHQTIRYVRYGFLLLFCSNFVPMTTQIDPPPMTSY